MNTEKKRENKKIKKHKGKKLFSFTKGARIDFSTGMINVVLENIFNFLGPIFMALAADILIKTSELHYPAFILKLVEIFGGQEELYGMIVSIHAPTRGAYCACICHFYVLKITVFVL